MSLPVPFPGGRWRADATAGQGMHGEVVALSTNGRTIRKQSIVDGIKTTPSSGLTAFITHQDCLLHIVGEGYLNAPSG